MTTPTGSQVRTARKLAGFTKSQLAQKLGISTPQINLIEKGQAELTAGELDKLMGALQLLHLQRQEETNP